MNSMKIRKNIHYLKLNASDAVEKAVIECIQEGVLRDFLIANRKEVVSMSIFEYDEEKELKLIREAEYQAGVEDGIEIGKKRHSHFLQDSAGSYLESDWCTNKSPLFIPFTTKNSPHLYLKQ